MVDGKAIEVIRCINFCGTCTTGNCKECEKFVAKEMAINALKRQQELKELGFTDEIIQNYKIFEDECVAKGFSFHSIITAREKMTAKSVVDRIMFKECPACGNVEIESCKCCPECGQKLLWE